MNPELDTFFESAKRWRPELGRLRGVLTGVGLAEARKWGLPCYTWQGRNVAILQPMKAHLGLLFFKGALLEDPAGILRRPGKASEAARRFEFTGLDQVAALEAALRDFLAQAIRLEDEGRKVPARAPLVLVEELAAALDADPALAKAFQALTPGRQRAYDLHVSGAKQAATRARRVEQHRERILAGKGLRD